MWAWAVTASICIGFLVSFFFCRKQAGFLKYLLEKQQNPLRCNCSAKQGIHLRCLLCWTVSPNKSHMSPFLSISHEAGLVCAIIISDTTTCQCHQFPWVSEIWIPEPHPIFIKQGSVAGDTLVPWYIKAAQTISEKKKKMQLLNVVFFATVRLSAIWLLLHCLQFPVVYQIYMVHKFQPVYCL